MCKTFIFDKQKCCFKTSCIFKKKTFIFFVTKNLLPLKQIVKQKLNYTKLKTYFHDIFFYYTIVLSPPPPSKNIVTKKLCDKWTF